MTTSLHEALGWLYVLVALAGMILCALHLGRTLWSALLMGGFAVEAATGAFYRVGTRLLATSGGYSSLQSVFLIMSAIGLLARLAIVGGVAGLLGERAAPRGAPPDRPPAVRV